MVFGVFVYYLGELFESQNPWKVLELSIDSSSEKRNFRCKQVGQSQLDNKLFFGNHC